MCGIVRSSGTCQTVSEPCRKLGVGPSRRASLRLASEKPKQLPLPEARIGAAIALKIPYSTDGVPSASQKQPGNGQRLSQTWFGPHASTSPLMLGDHPRFGKLKPFVLR